MKRSILFFTSIFFLFILSPFGVAKPVKDQETRKTVVYTPQKGTQERKAILDSVRDYLKKNFQVEAIFVVKHLKVKGEWAFLVADPRSPDGKNRYEGVLFLLKKRQDHWEILDSPSTDNPDEDPLGDKALKKLKSKYPQMPTEIFPRS